MARGVAVWTTPQHWRNIRHGGRGAAPSRPHHRVGMPGPSRRRAGSTSEQECLLVHGVFEHALLHAVVVGLEGVRAMGHGIEQVPWMTWRRVAVDGVGSVCEHTWGLSAERACSVNPTQRRCPHCLDTFAEVAEPRKGK